MIIILHTKKLIYLTRRICTLQRGPNCAITVLEFRIENCDLSFQEITNKSLDQLYKMMVQFQIITSSGFIKARESYFAEKKILCWPEFLKIVDFEKFNTDHHNEIQYNETLFLNLLWWAPTCRPRRLSSERKHYLDLAHSKSQTRFAWWRSTVKNNRLHNFFKMFLKRNSYFNALAFSKDLGKI